MSQTPPDPKHEAAHDEDPAQNRGPDATVFERPEDPAQQSLADALRVSFIILRAVMVLLVIVYLFSGIYQVDEQENVVVLRLGEIVEAEDGTAARGPGWYLGLPFPIDQQIVVPIAPRSVDISEAFVYDLTEQEQATPVAQRQGGPLNPELDGSLLTGDANIVHGRFTATYSVEDPAQFVANIPDADDDGQFIDDADELVHSVVAQGIIHAVAGVSADDFIGGRFGAGVAESKAQQVLNQMNTGIRISNINLSRPEMPVSVRAAYSRVAEADAQRSTRINQARTERTRLLGEAAGSAALPAAAGAGPLVELIKEYALATANNNTQRRETLDARLSEAFRQLAIQAQGQTYNIGGETAQIINDAQLNRTRMIEAMRAQADTVRRLQDEYNRDPQLFRTLMWQTAARQIFGEGSNIELWYVMPDQELYIQMNRDPQITREREIRRLEGDREELEADGQQ